MDELLTLEDVSRELKIETDLASAMVEMGQLPGFWLHGQWRSRRQDLNAWTAELATGPSATSVAVALAAVLAYQANPDRVIASISIDDHRKRLELRARRSKTFCAAPWVHFLTFTEGSVMLCCMDKQAVRKADGTGVNVRETDPAVIWNGPEFREIRRALLDGETLPHCVTCQNYEAMGHTSYRLKFNKDYFGEDDTSRRHSFLDRVPDPADPLTAAKPIFLDIRLGNICNLKCRMCGPSLSSQIEKDKVASAWIGNSDNGPIGANVSDWPEAVTLLAQMKNFVVDALQLELVGGEPTLNQTHLTLLQHLVDENLAANIDVLMISNMTNVNDRIYDLLSHFKSAVVHFSCEAIGQVNDYIRFPSKWNATSKRLVDTKNKYPQIWFGISPTWQAYNVLNITELLDWCVANDLKFGTGNILLYPDWLSVLVLPQHIRDLAADRVQTWIDLNAPEPGVLGGLDELVRYLRDATKTATEQHISDFVRFTNDLDRSRQQDIRESLPELYELLNQHRPWNHELFRHRKLVIGRKVVAAE